MPILGELARWGYAWAWSAPRAGECVDLGAIFRLAPGLLRVPAGVRGTLECIVTGDGDDLAYRFTASEGRVMIEERGDEHADARVIGTTRAWIKAFSPDGDRTGLEVSGDRRLAGELLDGLALSGESRAMPAAAIRIA
jgi:hypothetical protein